MVTEVHECRLQNPRRQREEGEQVGAALPREFLSLKKNEEKADNPISHQTGGNIAIGPA